MSRRVRPNNSIAKGLDREPAPGEALHYGSVGNRRAIEVIEEEKPREMEDTALNLPGNIIQGWGPSLLETLAGLHS